MRVKTRIYPRAIALAVVLLVSTCVGTALGAAPTIVTGTNTPEAGGVLLRGYVNPQGSKITACSFEFGPADGDYSTGSISCKGPIGASAAKPVLATAVVSGLAPGTLYHFRITATNASGTVSSDDSTFLVPADEGDQSCPNQLQREGQHATFLPNCRAYEMTSPLNKLGNDVMPFAGRTRAAVDGSAVQFTSLGGFPGSGGVSLVGEYISERTGAIGTSGWLNRPITPPQSSLVYNAAARKMEARYWDFSENLDKGVFRSYSPLTDDPDVALTHNLYLRENLRDGGSAAYSLLTACPACQLPGGSPLPGAPSPIRQHAESFFVGASRDYRHLVFESDLPLTADSTADPYPADPLDFESSGKPNIFEWEDGVVRLVSLIPPGGATECGPSPLPQCEPAPVAVAGRNAFMDHLLPNVVSSDGRRVSFTVPQGVVGTGCFAGCGELFLRLDNARTLHLNASERSEPDPGGAQPATYENAAPDGARIFFTSVEALTDGAPVNPGKKLYAYDVEQPPGDRLTLVAGDVIGLIGVGDDGTTAYFVSKGQLSGWEYLYRWHNGAVESIGAIPGSAYYRWSYEAAIFQTRDHETRVTPDGENLLFPSSSGAELTGYPHGAACKGNGTTDGACFELYLFNARTHSLVCVSCRPDGAPASDATDSVGYAEGASSPHVSPPEALSRDGRYVFFTTADPLVARDTNGVRDAYEYDARTNEVHLLSTGTSPSPSYFLAPSPDGSNVFVGTDQQLLGWDVDQNLDLYDARVGGGFAEPEAATVCQGESCREGAGREVGGLPAIGSSSFVGPGNQAKKHRRHRHRKSRHRHRKKRQQHHHQHQKTGHAHRPLRVEKEPVR